jgi:hypothetical protein
MLSVAEVTPLSLPPITPARHSGSWLSPMTTSCSLHFRSTPSSVVSGSLACAFLTLSSLG